MIKDNNKFNFFIPAEFVKGGKDGKQMFIKGIASSEVEDSDGETLSPAGFDLTPLLTRGFLNYNHQSQKDASAIIGEPTKAEIINNGRDLYIEGFLYPDSEAARKTYELAQVLEKNSPNRRMGFSIEGKALEKDPFNPKKITKARITGVALTACPKNPNTLLSIMKGEYAEPWVDDIEKGDIKLSELVDGYSKWTNNKPDSEKYGCEGDVKEFLENNYEDNLHQLEDLRKAITAASGTIQTESVDGGKKVFDELQEEKTLKKSEVYSAIVNRYSNFIGDDIEKAKQTYKLIQEFNNKLSGMENTNNEIFSKALENAFAFIDDQINEISKGKDNDDKVEIEEDVEIEEEKNKEPKKEDEEENKVEKGIKDEFEITELQVPNSIETFLKTLIQSSIEKGMTQEEVIEDMVKKGLDSDFSSNLVKSVVEEMSKLEANGSNKEDGLKPEEVEVEETKHSPNEFAKSESNDLDIIKSELIKSFEEQQTRLAEGIEERFKALGNILKSQNLTLTEQSTALRGLKEENTDLKKSLAEANSKISNFGVQSQGRRSVVSQAQVIERFPNDIKKSESGKDTYSLKDLNDVHVLTTRLSQQFEEKIQKGENDVALGDAVLELSLSKSMSRDSVARIKNTLQALNIEIV